MTKLSASELMKRRKAALGGNGELKPAAFSARGWKLETRCGV